MTVVETLLVFVGAPVAVVVVLALLIFLPGGLRHSRYKAGQPWPHAPVWFEPHPRPGHAGHGAHPAALGSSASAGPLGGARGTW